MRAPRRMRLAGINQRTFPGLRAQESLLVQQLRECNGTERRCRLTKKIATLQKTASGVSQY
jgi:hypothetical protein